MMLPRVRFTVRRLMAIVALMAFLMAGTLLVLAASESSQRAECSNHLKQICLTLHSYHSVNDAFPTGTTGSTDLPPGRRLAWTVVIFQFVEQGLSLLIDLTQPWDSLRNLRPLFRHTNTDGDPPPYTTSAEDNPFLRCPIHRGRVTPKGLSPTDYVGIAGLGTDAAVLPLGHPRAGLFGYDRKTTLSDVRDGAGVTMMLAESDQHLGPWTAGGPPTVRGLDPGRRPYIGRGCQFGGTHRGGGMVAFADGSVRFLRESIDPHVFEALSTVAGGEPLPAGWDR